MSSKLKFQLEKVNISSSANHRNHKRDRHPDDAGAGARSLGAVERGFPEGRTEIGSF